LAIVVLLSFARLCRILPDPGDISSNILENAIRPASSHALSHSSGADEHRSRSVVRAGTGDHVMFAVDRSA
jgi:hypothetical protein